eukprot:7261533-Pyramimonas_sp.AAC.1
MWRRVRFIRMRRPSSSGPFCVRLARGLRRTRARLVKHKLAVIVYGAGSRRRCVRNPASPSQH